MKCPHCKKVPYPAKNADGTLNWKNILRIDWWTILFIVWILFIAWAYQHDTAECMKIVEQPYTFCEDYCARECFNNRFIPEDLLPQEVPSIFPQNETG